MKTAGELLKQAADMVDGSRQTTHGDKAESFDAVARMWTEYLVTAGKLDTEKLDGRNVAQMMELLKMVRSLKGNADYDHFLDGAGYAGIAGELGAIHPPIPITPAQSKAIDRAATRATRSKRKTRKA